mmetsp:Transcript_799/g.3210  ORF Transcript_799/g.3210 Transcript_799/m.3210 type:complete len:316 (+) Transcript_799:38-985(+)
MQRLLSVVRLGVVFIGLPRGVLPRAGPPRGRLPRGLLPRAGPPWAGPPWGGLALAMAMQPAGSAGAAGQDDRLMPSTGGVDPNANGPLDCHGSGSEVTGPRCHDECEARHLDVVERSRFVEGSGFRYPRKPSIIIAASRDMGRTASTWVFNAVRLLFRQAHEACDSYWMRKLTREKLERRLDTGAHLLVKTHEWTPQVRRADFEALAPMFSAVVVSVREGFEEDPEWMRFATHVIHFEDIVAKDESEGKLGPVEVLRRLAEHLGITGLADSDLRMVDYELMTLPMPRHGNDPTTKHWSFHARRGGRPTPEKPSSP